MYTNEATIDGPDTGKQNGYLTDR